eukprot:scaffold19075_cov92-Cylindrotheca_fusiformis.AAC.3
MNQCGVLNDPTRLGGARLQLFQDHPVGEALIVSLGSGNTPFITVVANPTITPVDPTNQEDFGAPYWDEAFEPGILQRVLSPGVTRTTHSCLVSMGWQTREGGLKPKEELLSIAKPVVLTPDTQLGELAPDLEPTVDDPSRGSPVFKVLLWPELCSPPVGLFWPTTTTFQEFCDSLKGNTLYTAFLDCCGPNSMVAKWFERVNRDYISCVVHLTDAVPLWEALPSPRQPRGQNIRQLDLVNPFRYQFDRFLWAIHCDRIQRSTGICTTRAEKLAFSWYLHHGAKLYPHGLCDSQAPATHQAFFGHLFRPNPSGWPDSARNLLEGFDSQDRETAIPDELHEFGPTSVPTVPDDSFQPARLAFAEQQDQAPLQVVHAPTEAPSPAPGPAAVAGSHPPPLVTPAGGGPAGRPGPAAAVTHQQHSPDIFSISTSSVHQPPVLDMPPQAPTQQPHQSLQQVGPSIHPVLQQAPAPPAPQQLHHNFPQPASRAVPPPVPPQTGPQTTGHVPAVSTNQVQQQQPFSGAPVSTLQQQQQHQLLHQPAQSSGQQQQTSPPWWAPTPGTISQPGGQSSFQQPHGTAQAQFHHPLPTGPSGPPPPAGNGPVQIFSPSTSSLRDVSAPAGQVGLLQSAAPRRNLFGVSAAGSSSGLGGAWMGSAAVKGPQYLSMMDAGIGSAGLRASSPPTFLALCFLLSHHRELSSATQVHRLSDGAAVPLESFVLLRQPCLVARPVLRVMESKTKDLCAPMLHYLQGRIRSDPVIGRMGVPVQLEFCSNEFVSQAFTLSGWVSITHEPPAKLYSGGVDTESKPQFHPLFFQRALDSSLPSAKVPATGYSRQAAVVLGSLILFFYQFLDIKVDATGHTPDTTSFDCSCFGALLSRWAAIPASPVVDAAWSAHPLRCSAWWIAHLLELFKIFSDHHSQRVMLLGETNPAVGIEEVMISPPGETVVVGTNYVPTRESAFRSHSTIQTALTDLEQRMRQLWEQQVALGPQASIWSAHFPDHLCDNAGQSPSNVSSGTNASAGTASRSSQSRSDNGDSQRKRSRPAATPFVPQKPLMAFSASASSAPQESPFSMLRNRNERDWPRIRDPQGKQHEPCQLCFACCFPPPFNHCGDPDRCHILRRPVYARSRRSRSDAPRLHIDLADDRWSAARYPEQNWKPVVDFIKRNLDILAPSPELIALTPSTRWSS